MGLILCPARSSAISLTYSANSSEDGVGGLEVPKSKLSSDMGEGGLPWFIVEHYCHCSCQFIGGLGCCWAVERGSPTWKTELVLLKLRRQTTVNLAAENKVRQRLKKQHIWKSQLLFHHVLNPIVRLGRTECSKLSSRIQQAPLCSL
jgi:hypothetical protein